MQALQSVLIASITNVPGLIKVFAYSPNSLGNLATHLPELPGGNLTFSLNTDVGMTSLRMNGTVKFIV